MTVLPIVRPSPGLDPVTTMLRAYTAVVLTTFTRRGYAYIDPWPGPPGGPGQPALLAGMPACVDPAWVMVTDLEFNRLGWVARDVFDENTNQRT